MQHHEPFRMTLEVNAKYGFEAQTYTAKNEGHPAGIAVQGHHSSTRNKHSKQSKIATAHITGSHRVLPPVVSNPAV